MAEEEEREPQIANLLAELRQEGIRDERVLHAIATVPRERFIPGERRGDAWKNIALPIGAGQTISQPFVVALMTEALELSGRERVLEVGTGSGYQTAVLAELAGGVISLERHAALGAVAETVLTELGYRNIVIHITDGTGGWPAAAPYDRILVTAASPQVPPLLRAQLSPDGGRLVIPVGDLREQRLVVVERAGDDFRARSLGPVRFVPLVGRAGWAARMQPDGNHG